MAWYIDRDYLDGGTDRSNVGRRSVKEAAPDATRYRWRLLDDDGNVYYGGWLTTEHDDDGDDWESSPYGLYKWGEVDSGTTDLQMHVKDAIAAGLSTQQYADATNRGPDDWVGIYG